MIFTPPPRPPLYPPHIAGVNCFFIFISEVRPVHRFAFQIHCFCCRSWGLAWVWVDLIHVVVTLCGVPWFWWSWMATGNGFGMVLYVFYETQLCFLGFQSFYSLSIRKQLMSIVFLSGLAWFRWKRLISIVCPTPWLGLLYVDKRFQVFACGLACFPY